MYLALISLYLLICFNYEKFYEDNIKINSDPWYPENDKYKDMNNRLLPKFRYCEDKPCLIKCCGNRQYLDSTYTCKDEKYFKEIYYKKTNIGINNWTEVNKELERRMDALNNKYVLIQRVENSVEPMSNFSSLQYRLVEPGYLEYTKKNSTEPWKSLQDFRFCVDYLLNSPNEKEKFNFVFEVVKEPQDSKDRKEKNHKMNIVILNYTILAAGVVITILSMAWLLYRLRKQVDQRLKLYSVLTYLSCSMCAYGVKLFYLIGLNLGIFTSDECKYFGVPIYFLLLSIFCWPIIISSYLIITIKSCYTQEYLNHKENMILFKRYCVYTLGLPSLLTVTVLILDKLYPKTWIVQKPPFDSCFENEKQTMLYLYVPITFLSVVNSAVFCMFYNDLRVFIRACRDDPLLRNKKNIIFRSLACEKSIGAVIVVVLLQFIPDIPPLLKIALYVFCISSSCTLLFVIYYNKSELLNLYKRFTRRNKIEES